MVHYMATDWTAEQHKHSSVHTCHGRSILGKHCLSGSYKLVRNCDRAAEENIACAVHAVVTHTDQITVSDLTIPTRRGTCRHGLGTRSTGFFT